MKWLQRMNEAIDYIEHNLDQEISIEEAAKIACCSKFYFQRMFSYVADITLAEYIRRRKMTQAAFDLQQGKEKVSVISLRYGYTSPTAFNRAFQQIHGVSPSKARSSISLKAFPAINLEVSITGDTPLNYRIEKKKPLILKGFSYPLTDDILHNQGIVPMFWKEFHQKNRIEKLVGEPAYEEKRLSHIFGVTYETDQQEIRYLIGTNRSKDSSELETIEIPAATWAVFQCYGDFEVSVQMLYKRFIDEWLPFSNYQYAQYPDVEAYPVIINQTEPSCEVWIAIKEKELLKNG